jgi:hypothetical protein
MMTALFAEIDTAEEGGAGSSLDLDKVKRTWAPVLAAQALQSNAFWVDVAGRRGTVRHPIRTACLDQMQRADALTADDVKLAAQRYFNTAIMCRWC